MPWNVDIDGGYMAAVYKYDLNDGFEVLTTDFLNNNINLPLSELSVKDSNGKCMIQMKHTYQAIYGMVNASTELIKRDLR